MSEFHQRKDYGIESLKIADCPDDPIDLLREWLELATGAMDDANAMVLSTVSKNGQPSSRVVLLRKLNQEGIRFYTSYSSHKGEDLSHNPKVSLNFFWREHERQVRVEGIASRLSSIESDQYFQSRPKLSQVGAMSSEQSKVLEDRSILEKRFETLKTEYESKPTRRPENWGGYLVSINRIEFWQGRSSRLHDRVVYTKQQDQDWRKNLLYP